jgi:heme/copper-type cytochrome/quinol oxidase subunit 3
MRQRPAADISALPTYGFGARSPIWWGTLGFIVLEGMVFAIAAGTYLFLAWLNPQWPIGRPPDLIFGTALLIILAISIAPNIWLDRAARAERLREVQIGLVIASAIGVVAIAVRAFEFGTMNVRWDANAYGSVQWLLLGLHSAHLLTDVGDTLVLTALMFTKHAHGKRFSDVSDNCFYWYFVVASWLPMYALIYWGPRL